MWKEIQQFFYFFFLILQRGRICKIFSPGNKFMKRTSLIERTLQRASPSELNNSAEILSFFILVILKRGRICVISHQEVNARKGPVQEKEPHIENHLLYNFSPGNKCKDQFKCKNHSKRITIWYAEILSQYIIYRVQFF